MKPKIHPRYEKVVVTCACGNTFETQSTRGGTLSVDICADCHPFFTGRQKLMDAAGRVERFRRKYAGKTDKPVPGAAEGEKLAAEKATAEAPAKPAE